MAVEEEFAIEIPDAEADKIMRAARARAGAPAWGDAEPRPQVRLRRRRLHQQPPHGEVRRPRRNTGGRARGVPTTREHPVPARA